MRKSIKILSTILALLVIFIVCNIENINAFFSDSDTLINEVKIGSIKTEIIEENDTKTIVPGDNFKKVVSVKNIGESPCYVRIRVLISPNQYTKELNLDINTFDWDYQNGYYYYKHVLYCGESTTPLFTQLTVPSGLKDGDVFDIDIYNESVQAIALDSNNNIITKNYLEVFDEISK